MWFNVTSNTFLQSYRDRATVFGLFNSEWGTNVLNTLSSWQQKYTLRSYYELQSSKSISLLYMYMQLDFFFTIKPAKNKTSEEKIFEIVDGWTDR